MNTVLVQVPQDPTANHALAPSPLVRELGSGEEAIFGRGGRGHPVDIELSHPGVSRTAGRVRATEDFWTISNLSPDRTYVVENPEGGGEFVKVAPRRLDMPVPFEFSRVVLPAGVTRVSFLVFAHQHTYLDQSPIAPAGPDATTSAYPLDQTAKYFLVLVALCEPRLRDGASAVIPSVPDVVRRLAKHPDCGDLSRSAVGFHIDYLARTKLRIRRPSADVPGARADWQRAALVSLALRFDLVRVEHIALLDHDLPAALVQRAIASPSLRVSPSGLAVGT
ncbi:hypothetical protein [Frankia sp. Cr1]|uniref:hypothetical protein n=1 Tax=Frankia sp. Cr1 TaxID=3073931 RepID=UPI002AD3E8C4|nr:hypothetical protein [Frankia sp. Cr1]